MTGVLTLLLALPGPVTGGGKGVSSKLQLPIGSSGPGTVAHVDVHVGVHVHVHIHVHVHVRQELNFQNVFNVSECTEHFRDKAEELAKRIMEQSKDTCPPDADALRVLRVWGFAKNSNRTNVFPEGADGKSSRGNGFRDNGFRDARSAWQKFASCQQGHAWS